jgi:hypothetical protein
MTNLMRMYLKDELTSEDILLIESTIDCGYIDTCDIFDDFVIYVSKNCNIDYDMLMNYKENYQNLLSHKENLTIITS